MNHILDGKDLLNLEMSINENIYLKAPTVIQNLLTNIRGFKIQKTRFNRDFYRFYNEYCNNLSLTEQQITELQKTLLRDFLFFANKSIFWKEKFRKYQIDLNASNIHNEIKKLPILTKNEVKEHINEITLKPKGEKIITTHTSGTTGSGLIFPQTRSMENKQWAIWWRYRKWHGISFNTWCGWFGGRSIMSLSQKKKPFWRINFPGKQILFSAHHLCMETAPQYFEMLRKGKIIWLHGYPSQLSLFASYVKELNLGNLPYLKIITTGAENLMIAQKKMLCEVFGVPIKQHYGLVEGVANFSEYPSGELKVDNDFCYVEFIPLTKDDSESCRIIGTNFSNYAFPLIRYDTSDIVKIEQKHNDTFQILSIDGRNEDFITLPNGVKLGRLDHIFKDQISIREAQIYQESSGHIIFKIVKCGTFSSKDENNLRKEIEIRIKDTDYSIEYVNSLLKSPNGKLKFVISDFKPL